MEVFIPLFHYLHYLNNIPSFANNVLEDNGLVIKGLCIFFEGAPHSISFALFLLRNHLGMPQKSDIFIKLFSITITGEYFPIAKSYVLQ